MLLLFLSKYPLTKQVFIQIQIKRYGSLGNAIVTFFIKSTKHYSMR